MSPAPASSKAPDHRKRGKVLVVGAGVAGIRASLDLAQVGCEVTLVDRAPAPGGVVAKLDRQFPNDHCGMCRMLPEVGVLQSSRTCLRKGLFHDRVDVHRRTSVVGVRGEPGAFEVDLAHPGPFVDTSRCGDCPGPCVDVCPVTIPEDFNHGLTRCKAIRRPGPLGLADTLDIDDAACTRCGACVDACPVGAIDLTAKPSTFTVDVDAVILAVGTSMHEPQGDPSLAFLSSSPNVMTALQFERLLGLSGPRRTQLLRPSDRSPVKHVGWLQCVGSRDRKHGRDFCSSICCMFALKQARLVRDIEKGAVEATIFFMDIRGTGRSFDDNRREALSKGVRLIRSRIHDMAPTAEGGIRIRAFDASSGRMIHPTVDLLVLSTGQAPQQGVQGLGNLFGFALGPDGYPSTLPFDKVKSPSPGVFLCGSATGPADISESIVSASAAASEACKLLMALGRNLGTPPPASRKGKAREPGGLLVLFCRCHLDPEGRNEPSCASQPSVEIHTVESPCLPSGAAQVRTLLGDATRDRVVFAACRTHASRRRLSSLADQEGFDPALIRVVDARQSILPLRMAVAELQTIEIPRKEKADPAPPAQPRALVVGGGPAGMRAALSLAQWDVTVDLVEIEDELGGTLAKHPSVLFGKDEVRVLVSSLRNQITTSSRIRVHLATRVVSSTVKPGGRDTLLRTKSGADLLVSHGATLLTTGGHGARTASYGYGTCDRILTQTEFEPRLQEAGLEAPHTVVMIQCVDSRVSDDHAYCSRICCPRALENAKRLQSLYPGIRIVVLYRDMMACGSWEHEYTAARRSGVLFIPYEVTDKPTVLISEGKPVVTTRDPVLRSLLQVKADWLVLSTAIEPSDSAAELARIFGVERDRTGFFREADSKWRPVELTQDGVYAAGTGHTPQPLREVLAQAEAAAQRTFEHLGRAMVGDDSSRIHTAAAVHHALCARCGQCVDACVFHARRLDEAGRRIVVDPLACRLCGACAVACPNGAARLGVMGERQVMAQLDAALEGALQASLDDISSGWGRTA